MTDMTAYNLSDQDEELLRKWRHLARKVYPFKSRNQENSQGYPREMPT
jgi:hypothetical protein